MTSVSETEHSYDPTDHYNRIAHAWGLLLQDNLHYGVFEKPEDSLDTATEQLTQLMLEQACLTEDSLVLDIGCGTGQPACTLNKQVGCRVVGISPSHVCVDAANQRASDQNVAGSVHFQVGDGMAIAFEKKAFDAVWVMESSHLMSDKAKMLKEGARVLKPGGKLVLCDIMLRKSMSIPEVIEYRDEFLLLKRVYGRAIMETPEFYASELRRNELYLDFTRDVTTESRPTFAHWRKNASEHRDAVIQEIGEQSWSDFIKSCDIMEMFWDKRILGYEVIAAGKPL